jgi:hypothetical protein
LSRIQQQLCASVQDLYRGIIVDLLDIATGNNTKLLMSFVELTFFDPG